MHEREGDVNLNISLRGLVDLRQSEQRGSVIMQLFLGCLSEWQGLA
jgi:hypothetical protein